MSAAASPWSRAEERLIVKRAVEYIRERVQLHEHAFAMEVGGHLFHGLFKGDRRLVEAGGEWKTRSMRSIASDPRVGSSEKTLSDCVHAYLAVEVFRIQAPHVELPGLSRGEWARIDAPLVGSPDALVELALWKDREGVSGDLLAAAAQLVRPYLESGGRLEDLTVRGVDSPYERMSRILGVIERWLDAHEIGDEPRRRAIEEIDRLVEALRG